MKVALITPYPPSRDGIADYAVKLVDALRAERADCDITVYQLQTLSLNPRTWTALYRELGRDRPDVVHVQFDISNYLLLILPLFATLLAVRRRGGPVLVATFHEAYRDRELYGVASIVFYRAFHRLFDRIYVHTRVSERRLIDAYGAATDKVSCIPHGAARFASTVRDHGALRSRFGIDPGRPVVLNFGYLYRTKGVEYLIDALALRRAGGHPMPAVLIAGEVPQRRGMFRIFQARNNRYLAGLKQRIRSADLEEVVTFTGYIAADELYSLFTLADVVVLPYLSVDQSGVLNTAIAARTPVIASDIGGLGETLADVGVLVPPRDSAAIARALTAVLQEPEYRAGLVERYDRLAEKLDMRQVAVALLADYDLVCANTGARSPLD
ncbi:MAG TPA: glycosyltransferase [Actinoplanes sp.]|jgi:glycosyltransferase involved in cell wall biosynthesis